MTPNQQAVAQASPFVVTKQAYQLVDTCRIRIDTTVNLPGIGVFNFGYAVVDDGNTDNAVSHYEAQVSSNGTFAGRRRINAETRYHDYIRHKNFSENANPIAVSDRFDLTLYFTIPRNSDKQFIIRFISTEGSTNSDVFSLANDCPKGN